MSKKDYLRAVEIIAAQHSITQAVAVREAFVAFFAPNPRFDVKRFREAVAKVAFPSSNDRRLQNF